VIRVDALGDSARSGDSIHSELARRQTEALERLATVSDPGYKPRRKFYQRLAAIVVASGGAAVGLSELGRYLWQEWERRTLVANWIDGARYMYEVEGQPAVAQDMLARADALSPHNPDVAKLSAYIDGMQTMERLLNLDRPFDRADLDAWGRALGQAVMLERVDSRSSDGLLLQGQLQLAIKEYDRAQQYLSQAREIEHRAGVRSAFSAWRLANVYLKQSEQHRAGGNAEAAASGVTEAKRLLDEAIAMDGDFKWGHLEKGQLLLEREGDAEAALECFERTVKIDPRFAIGWQNLAKAKARLDRSDEAIHDLLHALEIQPSLSIVMTDLAFEYGNQRSYEIALIFARRATEADPGSLNAWRFRGLLALEKARESLSNREQIVAYMTEAEDSLSRALTLNPRESNVYQERSMLYLETGRIQQAYEDAKNAVRFSGGKALAKLSLARALLAAQRMEDCEAAASSSIAAHDEKIDGSSVLDEALFIRAQARALRGDVDGATADWDAAVVAMERLGAPPDLQAKILCHRAQFRESTLSDAEGALSDFVRARTISESHFPAWDGEARVSASLQRIEAADRARQRLQQLRGHSSEAQAPAAP
jgi:tetratricopeptide (TPR) repeat protein